MTSHVEPIKHRHPLCAECGKVEAMTALAAKTHPRSRRSKRGGRYVLKAHDLCKRCWRALCAQHWVHGEVSA